MIDYYRAINDMVITTTEGVTVNITANQVIEVYFKKYYPQGTTLTIVRNYFRTHINEYENEDLSYLYNFIKI